VQMNKLVSIIFVSICLLVCEGSGQTCSDLKAAIDKTYGFKPSKMTGEQIDAKSSELDKVWNLVGGNPKRLLPCLRSEISVRQSDTFFRFNASNLLYKHDRSEQTKQLMIETYSAADLADINLRFWLPYMTEFGKEGSDVSKAAETWLKFPKPVYYLPQHGRRPIDKAIGALALFGSMSESVATPTLARLAKEESSDFWSIVIWILVNQATPESDQAVLSLSAKLPAPLSEQLKQDVKKPKLIEPRLGNPKTTRDTFIRALTEFLDNKPDGWIGLTTNVPDGEKDMVAVMTDADLPLIRRVRRHYAANPTPHLPDWYSSFTQVINSIRAKSAVKST
jgi:hypothetical protein